jgi:hypothetical protein
MSVYDPVTARGYTFDGTITTGGIAQYLWGGLLAQNGWAVYNPSSTDELWASSSTTAAPNAPGSVRIAPLGGYETPAGYRPYGAVSVYGAKTGQPITARGW